MSRSAVPLGFALATSLAVAGTAVAAPKDPAPAKGKGPAKTAPGKRTPATKTPGASKGKPLALKIGVADQKPDMFGDPRFAQIGVKHVRRSIPWDVLRRDWTAQELDAWLAGARARGAEPVLTFARSRVDEHRHTMPTTAQLQTEFRRLRQRYPWVRNYVAWNEANHCGEGTCRKPEVVVRIYKMLKRNCSSCRVVAATLVDTRDRYSVDMTFWARKFIRAAKEQPRYWGLHNYVGANRFSVANTKRFMAAVEGEVWLTEVGGLVSKRNSGVVLPQGPGHAARVTRFIFDRLVRVDRRITRVYLYHWNGIPTGTSWDSGLISADGDPRPALQVLAEALRRPQPVGPKRR
jgi:hypothetical protein